MMKTKLVKIFFILVIVASAGCSRTSQMHQKAIDSSELGNYNKALELYHKILEKKPNKPIYLNDYGWTLFMVDSLEKSIKVLEKARENMGNGNVLLKRAIRRNYTIAKSYLKARKHLESNEPQKALEELSKNKLYRSREMELAYYGLIYEKLGEKEQAEERWKKIIDTYANVNFNNKFYDMAIEKMNNN